MWSRDVNVLKKLRFYNNDNDTLLLLFLWFLLQTWLPKNIFPTVKKNNQVHKILEDFHTYEKRLQILLLDSRSKEIKFNFIPITILEHISSLFLDIKAILNWGRIIKLFVLENAHCVFYRKAQFYKQSSI